MESVYLTSLLFYRLEYHNQNNIIQSKFTYSIRIYLYLTSLVYKYNYGVPLIIKIKCTKSLVYDNLFGQTLNLVTIIVFT